MRQFFAMSQRGDLAEAVKGLKSPEFIMLLSNDAQFEEHVKAWPLLPMCWSRCLPCP